MRPGVVTDADTCREFVTPRLIQAGWGEDACAIGEQRGFTKGRIIVTGGKIRRGRQKRADYLQFYRSEYPLYKDDLEKNRVAFPGTASRNRTLGLGSGLAIEVAVPNVCLHSVCGRLQAAVAGLRVTPTGICNAITSRLPATLERVFGEDR